MKLNDRLHPARKYSQKMIFIAVDMTPALPGGKNGGAKILALELLKAFRNSASHHKFLILTAAWNHEELAGLDSPNMSRLCILKGEEPRPKPPATGYPGKLRRGVSKLRRRMKTILQAEGFQQRLSSRGIDLLFCPFTAPTYAEAGIATVSVVLDLQHKVYPGFFSPQEIDLRNSFMSELRKRADRIICISEYVRQTVLNHLGTEPEKTHSVPICVQTRLTRPKQKEANEYRSRLGIDHRSYMFYPGNFWPHKNHRMLLTAYGMFLARNPANNIDLVFTGALDEMENKLKHAVDRMGLKEKVHFLGFVSEDALAAVWHGCEFLIFPSLYEGFGIPVLEAMAIGKPVLASRSTSLPEVAGDAALFFDPRKPEEIVGALEQITRDKNLRKELIKRGFDRAADFNPEDMARKYLEIFFSAVKDPKPLSNGVSGIFDDGWTGKEMMITYGRETRQIHNVELRIEAPAWLPNRLVKLQIKDGSRVVQRLKLARGQEKTIRLPVPERQGSVAVLVSPTFCPSQYDMGEDTRDLGVICRGCWLVSPQGEKTSLLKAGMDNAS